MAAKLSASQIAAQAAMQHQSAGVQHIRKRSQTVPSPQTPPDHPPGKRKPAPIQTGSEPRRPSGGQPYSNGSVGGGNVAAATAASVAYPKSAPLSPGLTTFDAPPDKEHKLQNQRSKMKLFSKPKHITVNNNLETKDRPMPSPNKMGTSSMNPLGKLANASVTSFADSLASGSPSMYFSNNASTSTLIPSDRPGTTEREKKHHFLSRQKNKLKDKMDEHSLPLSSAASNSRPLDPAAPQPLYSFAAPSSPGPSTTSFAKTVSGLDLRHGGRALREKKKEEKAAAMPTLADLKRAEVERLDWAGTGPSGPVFGTSAPSAQSGSYGADIPVPSTLQGFGLNNMSAEDAWDFLRAKILIIFEGEELRMPVEDLNKLVLVNIQRCIAKRIPSIIIEDLRDLLQTGFTSIDQSLRVLPEHRLVPRLVDSWMLVFGTILPYVQAVFLPLDLEFKGHGSLMSPREAAEFWGANPDSVDGVFGSEFDVRRIVLLSYRDHVILPRHDVLKATFSRLSLESINPSVSLVSESPDLARPGTAASLDPGISSFNSQGSTLIGEGNRSRATSNLSAPDFPAFASPPRRAPQPDSTQITETVGRMLQCVSVLASVQSSDEAQIKMEGLAKELKLNWLGRGRTGRNRRGFVGTRTLACTTHPVEAKKAVAGRKISDDAWFRLQNPELDVRIRREARRAKKADERRKAETSQGSSNTKMGCTTSPAPEGSSLQAQWSTDPVGVMLALLVYSLLIAFAVGVESLRRMLANGDAWVTARLECPRVRQDKAVSVSRRESRSRRTTDVAHQPTSSRNIVEDVPSTDEQVQLAASREIVDAEILAVEVTAYRRELTAPREVIDAKKIANGVADYRRERHQELRKDLDEHLRKAAVITAQQIGGNQDGLSGPLLDDEVDPLKGLRMSEEEKKKKERVLESVRYKVKDSSTPSFKSKCERILESHAYTAESQSSGTTAHLSRNTSRKFVWASMINIRTRLRTHDGKV
ncbi:MAG: hypothetical protein Q9185_005783 [Variospora sp. 1 TL-2023]